VGVERARSDSRSASIGQRVVALVLCGNQRYAWEVQSPPEAVAAAIAAFRQGGMEGFVQTFESAVGFRLAEPERTWTLEKNEPAALGQRGDRPRSRGPYRRV